MERILLLFPCHLSVISYTTIVWMMLFCYVFTKVNEAIVHSLSRCVISSKTWQETRISCLGAEAGAGLLIPRPWLIFISNFFPNKITHYSWIIILWLLIFVKLDPSNFWLHNVHLFMIYHEKWFCYIGWVVVMGHYIKQVIIYCF